MAQPSKGQGVNGVCELLLTDATQITSECVKPIEATSRTFIQADVCFLKVFFSSLIRFQESPASVAVRAQVDYIRDDRFVMQCNDCKKVTLNEVRRFHRCSCDKIEIFNSRKQICAFIATLACLLVVLDCGSRQRTASELCGSFASTRFVDC